MTWGGPRPPQWSAHQHAWQGMGPQPTIGGWSSGYGGGAPLFAAGQPFAGSFPMGMPFGQPLHAGLGQTYAAMPQHAMPDPRPPTGGPSRNPDERQGRSEKPSGTAKANVEERGTRAWITMSLPVESRGILAPSDGVEALHLLLAELTNEEREGGALPGVPEKVSVANVGLPEGPWYFGFDNLRAARSVVDEVSGTLDITASADDSDHIVSLSVTTSNQDASAAALTEVAGCWLELCMGRSELITSREQGVQLVTEQLGVKVTRCKWPQPVSGVPDRSRLCMNIIPSTGFHLPPVVMVHNPKNGTYAGVRYRMPECKFTKGTCRKCHAKECLCEAHRKVLDRKKQAREAVQQRRAQQAASSQNKGIF